MKVRVALSCCCGNLLAKCNNCLNNETEADWNATLSNITETSIAPFVGDDLNGLVIPVSFLDVVRQDVPGLPVFEKCRYVGAITVLTTRRIVGPLFTSPGGTIQAGQEFSVGISMDFYGFADAPLAPPAHTFQRTVTLFVGDFVGENENWRTSVYHNTITHDGSDGVAKQDCTSAILQSLPEYIGTIYPLIELNPTVSLSPLT